MSERDFSQKQKTEEIDELLHYLNFMRKKKYLLIFRSLNSKNI